ncbi:unnamed protein product [Didymodactylos carnosus]|uniref:Uncharacterized protein n=1 Tax=Didymodactylos carnosus TaxID=1234261 RepID=A0A813SI55_9BILA|nr:unnamed protein product [Didymodactylos carnosus]CAF0795463.1 unnamed protein product [Didymodactylos carnosus]CAF3516750.1 unnamed protein product [Didymodactylos carnosus]CAF3580010.1 unnamed protein product [Didymodactylos carnosus]
MAEQKDVPVAGKFLTLEETNCTEMFYRNSPLKIVRCQGTYMFDQDGNQYLDCINNVAHVGHCHAYVASKTYEQALVCETNNRYLHDNCLILAERLTKHLPDDLEQVFFSNSGSEANDLAIQLARNYTNNYDILALDYAYHGHLQSLVEISSYKFKKEKNGVKKDHVHIAPCPDQYRGKYRNDEYTDEEKLCDLYVKDLMNVVEDAEGRGRKIAIFLIEPFQSCGGQIIYPKGYLKKAFNYLQSKNILCLADEVQTGFGRSGTHFWSFQTDDDSITPDFVTVGKSMGNGHPVSALITKRSIVIKAFEDNGIEYFNTFGGNPVSCVAALAVLDIVERENLMKNAHDVGLYLLTSLEKLKEKHYIIGDVRGYGLFVGVDLVKDRKTREPAIDEAREIQQRLRDNFVIMSLDGPYCNVLCLLPKLTSILSIQLNNIRFCTIMDTLSPASAERNTVRKHSIHADDPDFVFKEFYSKEKTIELRQHYIPICTQLFYHDNPLKIVRASGTYMYDQLGNKYLDCINNVAHVGHCHPHVTQQVHKQTGACETNNRYLHDNPIILAEKLCKTLPEDLHQVFYTNSGSEANDLAMRLAREYTGNYDVLVLDNAYHGHLTSVVELSSYKFKNEKINKPKEHVHIVSTPDVYRGKYRNDEHTDEEKLCDLYVKDLMNVVEDAEGRGRKIAIFLIESFQSCGGQIIYPQTYLKKVFKYLQSKGILCLVDEVQTGFGRSGTHFWAFQTYDGDLCPDFVTIGKSMGNGHPVAALITKKFLTENFYKNGVEYFNTFGGNPVSCRAGIAVLDVIGKENLMENAREVGEYLIMKLKEIGNTYTLVGDVRGRGLFIGVELIKNVKTREPAIDEAKQIHYKLLEHFVIMSLDGPDHNVLKIKPPVCFSKDDCDFLCEKLNLILKEISLEENK